MRSSLAENLRTPWCRRASAAPSLPRRLLAFVWHPRRRTCSHGGSSARAAPSTSLSAAPFRFAPSVMSSLLTWESRCFTSRWVSPTRGCVGPGRLTTRTQIARTSLRPLQRAAYRTSRSLVFEHKPYQVSFTCCVAGYIIPCNQRKASRHGLRLNWGRRYRWAVETERIRTCLRPPTQGTPTCKPREGQQREA